MTSPSAMPSKAWAVRHQLDRVELTIELPTIRTGGQSSLSATGRSHTKRSPLWTYAEAFDPLLASGKGYEVHDAVAHIALAALQDRPRSKAELRFALSGGVSWDEPELF